MHEWGMGGTSIGGVHGDVRNPWDVTRSPGGSSGGSAVAVAAGMAYAAIGTDGMGSVRSPASFCGVVGYKASAGRISRYGVLPPTTSPFDQIGILTRRARDLPTLLRILEGHDPRDPTSSPLHPSDPAGLTSTRLRVGLVEGDLLEDVVPDVDAATRDIADMLADLGHTVLPVQLPELTDLPLALLGAHFENQTFLLEAALEHPDSFADPDVRLRVLAAELVTDADARRARQLRARLRARLLSRFTEVDLLLLPTTPVPAFDAHARQVAVGRSNRPLSLDSPGAAKRLTTRLTVPWNVLGSPALSMPARLGAAGLPVGVQLVGAPGRDGMLLRAAAALEEAVGPYLAPPLSAVRA
jgi:aspartyl-tRNA(Asn)/glutamyl-tRNA(Gln) amidotransferase subunit A